jgi:hypothetical protein
MLKTLLRQYGFRCISAEEGFVPEHEESFDEDDKSLGMFVSVGDAAKAVLARLSSTSSST